METSVSKINSINPLQPSVAFLYPLKTIRQQPTNCLCVFGQFVGLMLKGLKTMESGAFLLYTI